jgi:glycosyltransferase involved in cell wall biosynthesis
VLLEASALSVPIAAMDTGGTADIVIHDETGLLSKTPGELSRDIARLARDEVLRERLGEAARAHVERTFTRPAVVDRILDLYEDVVRRRRRKAAHG